MKAEATRGGRREEGMGTSMVFPSIEARCLVTGHRSNRRDYSCDGWHFLFVPGLIFSPFLRINEKLYERVGVKIGI